MLLERIAAVGILVAIGAASMRAVGLLLDLPESSRSPWRTVALLVLLAGAWPWLETEWPDGPKVLSGSSRGFEGHGLVLYDLVSLVPAGLALLLAVRLVLR